MHITNNCANINRLACERENELCNQGIFQYGYHQKYQGGHNQTYPHQDIAKLALVAQH